MRYAVCSLAALSITVMPWALMPSVLAAQSGASPGSLSEAPRPLPGPSSSSQASSDEASSGQASSGQASSGQALSGQALSGQALSAQAPSAPETPAPAHTAPSPSASARPPETHPDFSGTWTLDTSISSDPSKASFEPSRSGGNQRYGGFGGGGRGRSRGGFGGAPPRQTSGGTADDRTPEEKARLQALTDELRKALRTLVISHHEPGFVINDALDHTQFLTTDDKPADQQIGAQAISTATHWEGTHLVTEYTLSDRHKLVFTYTLLAETKQMVLRVRLDDTERRRVVGQEVKLAYTLAPAAAR